MHLQTVCTDRLPLFHLAVLCEFAGVLRGKCIHKRFTIAHCVNCERNPLYLPMPILVNDLSFHDGSIPDNAVKSNINAARKARMVWWSFTQWSIPSVGQFNLINRQIEQNVRSQFAWQCQWMDWLMHGLNYQYGRILSHVVSITQEKMLG